MRRRDAMENSGSRTGAAASVALVLSLGLHAVLVLVLLDVRLPAEGAAPLLRVSLVESGGSGTALGGGSRAAVGPVAEPARREAEPKPVRQRPRRARRVAAKPVGKIARKAVAHAVERKGKPSAPLAVASQPERDAATTAADAVSEATSGVSGAGSGEGKGRGDGQGPGTGRGSGTGGGSGSGSGNGIDLRLVCVHCPSPAYPRRAVARGAEGTVDVWFSLRPDGTVKEATVRRSSGDRDLDGAALDVARRSRFRFPAGLGVPEARGFIAYQFQLARRADGAP